MCFYTGISYANLHNLLQMTQSTMNIIWLFDN